MRRLPVYVLLDCSESMIGPGLEGIRLAVDLMLKELRRNPHALETVWLSFITFDGEARQVLPLTALDEVQPPSLKVRPGTALGAALRLTTEAICREVRRTTADTKGDYRPLIFLITDGQPTDDWQSALALLDTRSVTRPANVYAIGCGSDVDFHQLGKITDIVLQMDSISTDAFAKLFIWLTASINSASTGVADSSPDAIVSNLPGGVTKIDLRKTPAHDGRARQVFLPALCMQGRGRYLLRYLLDEGRGVYFASAAHALPIETTSGETNLALPPLDSSTLFGIAPCPFCSNDSAAACGNCGAVFCMPAGNPPPSLTCPSCGNVISRGTGEGGHFEVRQSAG